MINIIFFLAFIDYIEKNKYKNIDKNLLNFTFILLIISLFTSSKNKSSISNDNLNKKPKKINLLQSSKDFNIDKFLKDKENNEFKIVTSKRNHPLEKYIKKEKNSSKFTNLLPDTNSYRKKENKDHIVKTKKLEEKNKTLKLPLENPTKEPNKEDSIDNGSSNKIETLIKKDYKGVTISTFIDNLGFVTGEVVFRIDNIIALKLNNNTIIFINSPCISGFF